MKQYLSVNDKLKLLGRIVGVSRIRLAKDLGVPYSNFYRETGVQVKHLLIDLLTYKALNEENFSDLVKKVRILDIPPFEEREPVTGECLGESKGPLEKLFNLEFSRLKRSVHCFVFLNVLQEFFQNGDTVKTLSDKLNEVKEYWISEVST